MELQEAGPQTGIDVLDLEDTLTMLAQENAPGGALAGALNLSRVGVLGMSEGSGAAATLEFEPAIGAAAFLAGVPPKNQALAPKPTLVMAGSADHIDAPQTARAVFARLPSTGRLFEVEGAGRQAFSDICSIGQAAGGVAKVSRRQGSTCRSGCGRSMVMDAACRRHRLARRGPRGWRFSRLSSAMP